MRTFVDEFGREWQMRLNGGTAADLQGVGFNVFDLFSEGAALRQRLATDTKFLVEVLWALVAGQRPDVTPRQFAEGLSGKALGEACEGLTQECLDFFHNRGAAEALRKALAKADQAQALAVEIATKEIDATTPEALAELLRKSSRPFSSASAESSESPRGT